MTAERKTIWSERLRTPAGIGTDTAFSQETASKFNPSCLSRTVLSMWYVHGAVRTGCTEQSVNSVVDSCCSMSPSTGEWLLGDQNHGKPQVGSDHYLDALLDFWQAMNTEADRTSIPPSLCCWAHPDPIRVYCFFRPSACTVCSAGLWGLGPWIWRGAPSLLL